MNNKSVIIVGSGISGLITAYRLLKCGYMVTIITKSPDPSIEKNSSSDFESSTFDGLDQRYITLFESHPYLELSEYVEAIYPGIASDFNQEVVQGGFLALAPRSFDFHSRKWLFKRSKLNQKLLLNDEAAAKIVRRLFVQYENENRASMFKWYDLLTKLIEENAGFADNLPLSYKGILRLYDQESAYLRALKSHGGGNVLIKKLSIKELAAKYPAYLPGVANGFIEGGALDMHGITLGIKSFCSKLISILEGQNVKFLFNTQINHIERMENGLILGLRDTAGKFYSANHYVLHPGAYADQKLFSNTLEAKGTLAAVEGCWIMLEHVQEIIEQMRGKANKVHGKMSLEKILNKLCVSSRRFFKSELERLGIFQKDYAVISPLVDFNIMPIVKKNVFQLGVGSGYIYLGFCQIDQKDKSQHLYHQRSRHFVHLLMQMWLEILYGKSSLQKSNLKIISQFCKRSWTYNDEELDISYLTGGCGLLTICGGGNTGSTTKAIFIADYVIEKIKFTEANYSHLLENHDLSCALNIRKFQEVRSNMGLTADQVTCEKWAKKVDQLDSVLRKARKL